MFPNVTLILGGASSGKSAFAEELVLSADKSAIYLATGQAGDDEMSERILRHQRSRGTNWRTLEVPLDVADCLAGFQPGEIILLDCATMWLSNHLLTGSDILHQQDTLLAALAKCAAPVVVVSNEVGLGGVSGNPLTRKFAQAQGALNIALARQAELAVAVTAGLPNVLKGTLPE